MKLTKEGPGSASYTSHRAVLFDVAVLFSHLLFSSAGSEISFEKKMSATLTELFTAYRTGIAYPVGHPIDVCTYFTIRI